MKNSTAFILLLVSAGLFYTFIMPEYDKVTVLRAQAADYENILTNISSLSDSRDALLVKYKALPPDQVAKLANVLPDHVDTVSFALDLDAIASKYGIILKSVTAPDQAQAQNAIVASNGKAASNVSYGSTDIIVTFVSDYPHFKSFLSDLEKSLRIIDVRSASFAITDSNLSEYSLILRTYWLK